MRAPVGASRAFAAAALGLAAQLAAASCHRKSAEESAAEQRAERIWRERCVSCHGERGVGDGPLAGTLKTRPRNFSDPAWQSAEFDDELEAVIIVGGAALEWATARSTAREICRIEGPGRNLVRAEPASLLARSVQAGRSARTRRRTWFPALAG